MKSFVTALAFGLVTLSATASPISFDPEVDADRPGRTVIHSSDSIPVVALATRVGPVRS